jgi:hypothetical protein
MNPTRDPTMTIGPKDLTSEESHRDPTSKESHVQGIPQAYRITYRIIGEETDDRLEFKK